MVLEKIIHHTIAVLIGAGLMLSWNPTISAQASEAASKTAAHRASAVNANSTVGCATTHQVNQPLSTILEDLARECKLSINLPKTLRSIQMTLQADRLPLEEALTHLFDSSALDYAFLCSRPNDHCSLQVFDFAQSGPTQGAQIVHVPADTQGAEQTYQIDLTNLQEKDIQRLRVNLSSKELELLRVLGFNPDNMTNQKIVQLVKKLTQGQLEMIEQIGLNPKNLSIEGLRHLLFSLSVSR